MFNDDDDDPGDQATTTMVDTAVDMLEDDVEFDDHSACSLQHSPKKRKCDKLLACFYCGKLLKMKMQRHL